MGEERAQSSLVEIKELKKIDYATITSMETHVGTKYQHDNELLFTLIEKHLQGTTGCNHVQQFQKTTDQRI